MNEGLSEGMNGGLSKRMNEGLSERMNELGETYLHYSKILFRLVGETAHTAQLGNQQDALKMKKTADISLRHN